MLKKKSLSYYISDNFLNLWIFKYTANKEITYELYNNQNKKIHSSVLAKECMNNFIVNIGKHNDIHVVIRKISGEVIYYFFNGKQWNATGLFHLNQQKHSFKLLGLYPEKKTPHILYSIKNGENNNWLIIDLYWENNKWNHVKVFQNTVSPSDISIATNQDYSKNIYLVSRWWDGEEYQLQFCQSNSKTNLWFQHSLTFGKGAKYQPNIFTVNNTLHTSWVNSTDNKSFSLYYRKKNTTTLDNNPWHKEQEIYLSHNKIETPFFAHIEDKLTLIWMEDKKFLYIESEDNGNTWDDTPKSFGYLGDPELIPFLYKSENLKNKSYYIVLDRENKKTYPFNFFQDEEGPNLILNNPLYPPSSSRENLEKKPSFSSKDTSDKFKNISSDIKIQKNTITPSSIQSMDDASIENLPEEIAKRYIKILRDYTIHLNKENAKLKNQLYSQSNGGKSSHHSGASLHAAPLSMNHKQILKENLKTKIVSEENSKLKTNIFEYKKLLEKLEKDIESLRNAVGHMDAVNKCLQNDIKNMKENSLRYKINKLFNGD